MDWIKILHDSLIYIETELGNSNLSPKLISKQVHMSESHYTRAFKTFTGYSLAEYIRKRRLTVAGDLLKSTDITVLDVSYLVGYTSPEAFSKAFKRYHGVNPSECKDAKLKEFYKLQVKVTLIQEKPIKCTIEHKDSFYLCGSMHYVPSDNPNATSYLWAQCETQGFLDECYNYIGFEKILGVSTSEGYTVKALCSIPSTNDAITIPNNYWAVFECEGFGPHGILETWDRIYSNWIPNTEYEILDLPQLEVYHINEEGYTCEIWIAVK